MSLPPRAVFISYASQDAEMAGRICEALRAIGVEVWFDRTELRSGDAWDQSIKRQIRECALFLPIVSGATQARREGYFRREWKQAVDRTHDMDDGVPFLLPVALDGVNESDAFVPEVFSRVQWTKFSGPDVPAAFVHRVLALLTDGAPAKAERSPRPSVERSAGHARGGKPTWALIAVGAAFAGVGLFFVVKAVFHGKKPGVVVAPLTPAVTAVEKKSETVEPAKLDSMRVVLARFENLSGDTSLDGVARLIEGELVRGMAAAPHVRLLPVEAATRSAAREAARKENAGSVIVGSYYREGENLMVSAEVVLIEQGTTFGTLGPVNVPKTVRSEAWAEFVERLITGANNAVVTLDSEPLRISGLVYARPWPRWSTGQKLIQLMSARGSKTDAEMLAGYRELLARYPELLRAKMEIARLLRDMGRMDEAEKEFNELVAMRSQLSAYELNELGYDLALLQGRPELALQAARGMIAIRDTGPEITQMLASLWALNRPRAAYQECKAWREKVRLRFPEAQRFELELGVRATQIAAEYAHDEMAAAEAHTKELAEFCKGRPNSTLTWTEMRVRAAKGELEPIMALLAGAAAMPADARVEPVQLARYASGVLQHRGFKKEADALDRFLVERWNSLPPSVRDVDDYAEIGWRVAMLEKHYDEALARFDDYEKRQVAMPPELAGYRALTYLQMGKTAEWQALDAKLEKMELRNQRGTTFYWRARIAAAQGDRKRATELLELAVANGLWFSGFRGGMSELGRTEPEFAVLRGYAPYELLLKPKD